MPQTRNMVSIKKFLELQPLPMRKTKLRKTIKTDPDFPAYFINGQYLIDLNKLDSWIEKCKVKPARAATNHGRRNQQVTKQECRVHNVITPNWDKIRKISS